MNGPIIDGGDHEVQLQESPCAALLIPLMLAMPMAMPVMAEEANAPTVHAIAGGYSKKKHVCDAKSVTVSKQSVTLAVGKARMIRAKIKGVWS